MKLTEWYSGDQKPVRVGVYEVSSEDPTVKFYKHWDGSYWGYAAKTFEKAYRWRYSADFVHDAWQNWPWRGVSK